MRILGLTLHEWILVIITAIFATIPIPLIKNYTINRNPVYLILIVMSFTLLIVAYIVDFTDRSITVIYPIIKIMAIILVVIIGIIIFREEMNAQKIWGIILGLTGVYLLSTSENH
jgi:multidrug transporter EmrE-like cation transporter